MHSLSGILSVSLLAASFGLFPLRAQAEDAALFGQIKSRYSLEEKKPYEPSIMGTWWEGSFNNMPVAFKETGESITIYAGKIEEITDIYLIRGYSKMDEVAKQLPRIVGAEGTALSSQFYLGAFPAGEFDMPQLRLPALRDGIPQLSASVQEVGIYEEHRGLHLQISTSGATTETIDKDLSLAHTMLKALERAP